MSLKMKKFMERPIQRQKKVIKEMVKKPIQNLINESVKIDPDDKEMLYYYIEHPININYTLKTYADEIPPEDRVITISRTMGTGNRCIVILYNGLVEIVDFITEMCDQMGWRFVSRVQEDTNKLIFEIYVKS